MRLDIAMMPLFLFCLRAESGLVGLILRGPQSCWPTQEFQSALRVPHHLSFFMMVAIVLQIPQTPVNCRFSCIHALNELLAVKLNNGSGV
jgi:hypothetical protein